MYCTAKSPVFSHVKASLDGLVTIRSSGKDVEKKLIDEFDELQDTHSEACYLIFSAANAIGLFVNFVIQIFIAIITFTAILMNSGKPKLQLSLQKVPLVLGFI